MYGAIGEIHCTASMHSAQYRLHPASGFVTAYAQTADGSYDIRGKLGMLMPPGARFPDFDIERTAADMVRLYPLRRPVE